MKKLPKGVKFTFYNKAYHKTVYVYEYEEICSVCNGVGIVSSWFYDEDVYCPLCDGFGKIDWITKITKSNNEEINRVNKWSEDY